MGIAFVLFVVEHNAGIEASLLAIDYREDLVLLRLTNQPVGGLAVECAEAPFTINDSSWNSQASTGCSRPE
jgi:hypothetical protein